MTQSPSSSVLSGRGKTTFACCGLLLLLVWFEGVDSQAYHFSKGWMPGRKRSPGPPSSSYAGDQAAEQEGLESAASSYPQNVYCQVRPQVRKVIADVIRAELRRLDAECDSKVPVPSGADFSHSFRQWIYKPSED